MRSDACDIQRAVLRRLLTEGARTAFGHDHSITASMTAEQFAAAVPVRDYDASRPYIDRVLAGQRDVLRPGRTLRFAKSSGTTSDRSKYIPVTRESLRESHLRGMYDVAAMYAAMRPSTRVFDGKTLTLGGSLSTAGGITSGDLSALALDGSSRLGDMIRTPRRSTALMENFDDKAAAICRECTLERVTSFAGVPSWNLVLMRRILEYTGRSNLLDVWPDLELFVHGGMGFAPYRAAYAQLLPDASFAYMETYNASEGFFAMADDLSRDDMLLMPDYGAYYEFRSRSGDVCPLCGVRSGERYALIITSCNGLWRYDTGDVVEFTSTDPYRIRLAGRTRQFINAFGEELAADNAEKALSAACRATGASVGEYTAAPIYMSLSSCGAHEWAIEFLQAPSSLDEFASALDSELRRLNSDYDAKRTTALGRPVVRSLPRGTFIGWLHSCGKNKVPHLCNDRTIIESLQAPDRRHKN